MSAAGERILVLGGTGLLGRAATGAFARAGYPVRVMSREAERARGEVGETVEIVAGDVADLESLRRAMTGCFGVHISVGGSVDRLSAENVCGLAGETGVERITYISGATVAEENRWFPMVAQKLEAERAVRESGLSYTIFCPTWPMEMLVRFARNGNPAIMGAQPYPIHWYAVDELGRMVAASYARAEARDKRLYIHGPEGIPMGEALRRYCAYFYPTAKVSVMPIRLAKLMGALTGNAELKYVARLMAYFDKVGEMGDPAEANAILGAPSLRLEEWMASLEASKTKGGSQ